MMPKTAATEEELQEFQQAQLALWKSEGGTGHPSQDWLCDIGRALFGRCMSETIPEGRPELEPEQEAWVTVIEAQEDLPVLAFHIAHMRLNHRGPVLRKLLYRSIEVANMAIAAIEQLDALEEAS